MIIHDNFCSCRSQYSWKGLLPKFCAKDLNKHFAVELLFLELSGVFSKETSTLDHPFRPGIMRYLQ